MENKEITKTFPVAETFLASWRYCRENRRHIAVFTLVNWLLLLNLWAEPEIFCLFFGAFFIICSVAFFSVFTTTAGPIC